IDRNRSQGDRQTALRCRVPRRIVRISRWTCQTRRIFVLTASNSNRPPADWLAALPRNRLLAEMSLWSADLGRLGDDIARVEAATDIFHIDVADGHFSPALLFFPDLVAVARRATAKPLHVHLMVADAILQGQVEQF